MLYLLGVDHEIQHNRKLSDNYKFSEYLSQFCLDNSISCIAEEFSIDAFTPTEKQTTVVYDISFELNIKHFYCSPTRIIREQLHIDTWAKREDYWLEEIKKNVDRNHNNLLVCGFGHLKTFPLKLSQCNWEFNILTKHFNYQSTI